MLAQLLKTELTEIRIEQNAKIWARNNKRSQESPELRGYLDERFKVQIEAVVGEEVGEE